jgi:hypothetical protein
MACLSLTSAEWTFAGFLFSLSAINFLIMWEKLRPETERSARWTKGVSFVAGISFLTVGYAYAITGDIGFAIASGFCGTVSLMSPWIARRRRHTDRPTGSVSD